MEKQDHSAYKERSFIHATNQKKQSVDSNKSATSIMDQRTLYLEYVYHFS